MQILVKLSALLAKLTPKKTSFACFQKFFEPLLCLYFNKIEILAKSSKTKFRFVQQRLLQLKKFLLVKIFLVINQRGLFLNKFITRFHLVKNI